MKAGEVASAVRRALNKFDEWNDVTGFVTPHTGYYYELQGVIEDAVHCGIQGALGVKTPLPSEADDVTPNSEVKGGRDEQ